MATGSELRREKWVDAKPLLVVPTIRCLHEDIARGHMLEGDNRKGASA
jgi:hypothetical protein